MKMKINESGTFAYLALFINVVMPNRWSPCSETHCHVTHHKNTWNEDLCLCVRAICIGTVVLKDYNSQTLYFTLNLNQGIESILGYLKTLSTVISFIYPAQGQPLSACRKSPTQEHGCVAKNKLQPNPVITTSVYATPRLWRQIFCGTN